MRGLDRLTSVNHHIAVTHFLQYFGVGDRPFAGEERGFQQPLRIQLVWTSRRGSPGSFGWLGVSTLDLFEHLLNVGGRELITRRGADGAQLGVEVAAWFALPRLAQHTANPVGDGHSMPACDLLNLVPFVRVEEYL
ncbi:hypothetical protein AWC22_21730 [Mycobacterium riyadhense]|uniref:Uncharacterized protein n=1 Tax=Mycobacterium riyadhense TaxID=486698 RepID=A0A1X2CJP7_9MYCO|nr:hypothetical protein AWC22_21730 [Mycobacterium riyadhense]